MYYFPVGLNSPQENSLSQEHQEHLLVRGRHAGQERWPIYDAVPCNKSCIACLDEVDPLIWMPVLVLTCHWWQFTILDEEILELDIKYSPSGFAAQNENLRLIQGWNYYVAVFSYGKAIALVLWELVSAANNAKQYDIYQHLLICWTCLTNSESCH